MDILNQGHFWKVRGMPREECEALSFCGSPGDIRKAIYDLAESDPEAISWYLNWACRSAHRFDWCKP
jgi:hypothetical protein